MVLRLFVPPGEGQHKLVPRRPDPIGANATLQYSIISSTALAAAYTTFASSFGHRASQLQPISRTGLFVRSSARLGLWAGIVGTAVNWYYYSAFASVVVSQKNPKVKPWKLYKRTKRYTVDDGCLAGAALGVAASIPTLFLRRPAIPRWTRVVGMTNIGACTGLLSAHGYFQYTGQRQKAYKVYERRSKRRSLEFWAIYWDKKLMAQFDPLVQQYVRHNGFWYTQLLPQSVFDRPDDYGNNSHRKSKPQAEVAPPPPPADEPAYYTQPYDYAEDLLQIDLDSTYAKMDELEAERRDLMDEAEYLLFLNATKQHEYCYRKDIDEDERKLLMREIFLIEISFNRIRGAANAIDIKLEKWRMSLHHKALLESSSGSTSVAEWLPISGNIEYGRHRPTLSIQEFEKFQTQIGGEVKRFEELVTNKGYPKEKREKWKRDLEDGRRLLQAADYLVFQLEKTEKALQSAEAAAQHRLMIEATPKTAPVPEASDAVEGEEKASSATAEAKIVPDEPKHDKTQVEKREKTVKSPTDSLDPDKP